MVESSYLLVFSITSEKLFEVGEATEGGMQHHLVDERGLYAYDGIAEACRLAGGWVQCPQNKIQLNQYNKLSAEVLNKQ